MITACALAECLGVSKSKFNNWDARKLLPVSLIRYRSGKASQVRNEDIWDLALWLILANHVGPTDCALLKLEIDDGTQRVYRSGPALIWVPTQELFRKVREAQGEPVTGLRVKRRSIDWDALSYPRKAA